MPVSRKAGRVDEQRRVDGLAGTRSMYARTTVRRGDEVEYERRVAAAAWRRASRAERQCHSRIANSRRCVAGLLLSLLLLPLAYADVQRRADHHAERELGHA